MALRERKRPRKDDSSESDGDQQDAGSPGLQETKSLQEVVKRREKGSANPRTLASMAERAGNQKRGETAGKPTNQDGSNKSAKSMGTDKPTVEKSPTSPS
ncbi:hypothetical protein GF325_11100, partial [Candidatus Bathyarchaeota archaeon]|nr:hypothetical protein [Candidatus Bathyarchaeota archaeon]